MKIEIMEINPTDSVMVTHNIGSLPPNDVDAYVDRLLPKLKDAFHGADITLFPVRDGEAWQFVVIRKGGISI